MAAQAGELRECCGSRYRLAERHRSGSVVERFFVRDPDGPEAPDGRCVGCGGALLWASLAEPAPLAV